MVRLKVVAPPPFPIRTVPLLVGGLLLLLLSLVLSGHGGDQLLHLVGQPLFPGLLVLLQGGRYLRGGKGHMSREPQATPLCDVVNGAIETMCRTARN